MKKPLLIVILLLNIIFAYAQPSAAEYGALMDLYNSTDGPNWTNNTGWSTANPNVVQSVQGWYGVEVDQQGHVIALNLSWNNLSGSLPNTIGNLPYLVTLSLNDNQITGIIPTSIGNLTGLQNLYLYANTLSGGIPVELSQLSSLKNLFLQHNALSGSIPPQIGSLSSLIQLQLHANQLSGSIPSELGNLSNLEVVTLNTNQLTDTIPSTIGNLAALTSISLQDNELTGPLPAEIGDLDNLQYLYLHGNNITGSIPAAFEGLNSLKELFLQNNNFTGAIPAVIGSLTNLVQLQIQQNQLSGSIPPELGYLTNLQVLALHNNELTGPIPTSLGGLAAITSLGLQENQLSGTLPSQLGSLNTLQYLYLNNNNFTGSIPSELSGLSSLRVLLLQANSLSGSIPSSLGLLTNLKELQLQQNQLTGLIPAELGNLSNLNVLSLNSNQLTGSIPSSLGNLLNIHSLSLAENQVSGPIPPQLGNLNTLQYLYLNNNNLSGNIPTEFGELNNLKHIYLNSNNLSGSIPLQWNTLENLSQVYLTSNKFSFSDLLVFKENFANTFGYNPQDSIDSNKKLLIQSGDTLTLTTNIDRATTPSSKYQWFKIINGSPVQINELSEAGHTIKIPSITSSDIGSTYFYKIYNDSISDLILTSKTQTLILDSLVGDCMSTLSEEFSALMDLYNAANGDEWIDNTGWRDANPNVPQIIDGWYGIRTDENGHVTDIDLDGTADFTYITDSQGLQVYTGNNLQGVIPTTIGNLSCLRVLNVGGNQLSGSLPTEIGELTNLVWLIGSTNQFSGAIPSSIGNLTKLDRIFLEKNQLTDSILPSIGNLPDLWALLLNDNQLSGPIPPTLGNLKKLRFFYLYNNQLTGPIPTEIGTMTAAFRIGFQNNQLTGSIPASLSNLSNLQLLHLSHNKLEGVIPPGLSSIAPLTTVVFNNNKLTFSSFLELKSIFTGNTFNYSPQDLIDLEKITEGTIGEPLTLTTTIDRNTTPGSIYQWFKILNGNTVALNEASITSHSFTFSSLTETDGEAQYYYTITNPVAPNLTLTSRLQTLSVSPLQVSSDVNYIRTIDVTIAGKTESAQVETASVDERITNYTYFDGLGRPIQQVAQQSSPLKKDIITPIVYDEFGREARKYLPFVSGSNGSYRPNGDIIDANHNYTGIAQPFYAQGSDNKIADDPRPYSQVFFEPSPLNRPDKEYGAGQAWAPTGTGSNNKFIQHNYLSNVHSLTGSGTSEAIIAWDVNGQGELVLQNEVEGYIAENGYYESSQLYIKSMLDEHGNAVREYTNKNGQVILKKVQAGSSSTNLNNPDEWACTYYIYDDLGNLRFVLSPEGVKQYLEVTAQN